MKREKPKQKVRQFPVGAAVLDKDSQEMGIVVAGFIEQCTGGRTLYVLSHPDGTLSGQYGESLQGCRTSALPEVRDLAGRDPLAAQRRVLDSVQTVQRAVTSIEQSLKQLAALAE